MALALSDLDRTILATAEAIVSRREFSGFPRRRVSLVRGPFSLQEGRFLTERIEDEDLGRAARVPSGFDARALGFGLVRASRGVPGAVSLAEEADGVSVLLDLDSGRVFRRRVSWF